MLQDWAPFALVARLHQVAAQVLGGLVARGRVLALGLVKRRDDDALVRHHLVLSRP